MFKEVQHCSFSKMYLNPIKIAKGEQTIYKY